MKVLMNCTGIVNSSDWARENSFLGLCALINHMSLFLSSSFEVSFLSPFSHFSLFSFLSYLFSFHSSLCFYFPSLLFPSLSLNPCLLYKISFMVHGIACTFLMFRRRKNVFVISVGYCHLYIDLFVCRDSYAWWIKSLVER